MAEQCLLFPGQGAQKVGMGKSLFEVSSSVKELFQKADNVLGREISKICFDGPEEELNRTSNAQVALLCSSMASLEIYKQHFDYNPKIFCGLSLGEYSAQVAAGVLRFEDALNIVQKRSDLMQEACESTNGGMASIIGLDLNSVKEVCESVSGYMTVANLNCPGQIVISGDKDALEEATVKAKQAGAKLSVILKVAGAFHSKLMKEAAISFKEYIQNFSINKERLKYVLSNVSGSFYNNDSDWQEMMSAQIISPVLFEENLRLAINSGPLEFVEIGTGKTLAGMLKRVDRKIKCLNIDTIEDVQA